MKELRIIDAEPMMGLIRANRDMAQRQQDIRSGRYQKCHEGKSALCTQKKAPVDKLSNISKYN